MIPKVDAVLPVLPEEYASVTCEDWDRVAAEKSLREFVEQAWPVVEPTTPFVPGWHIDVICEHLQAVSSGKIRDLLINEPPRHSKSTIVSVMWPVWEWIENPGLRWLCSSYALPLSERDAVKSRRLIQSRWFQSNWGDRFRLTSDQNAKQRYDNDKLGSRVACSVGGSATGEGGDRLVFDDPHNVNEAESETARAGVLDWYNLVMSTRRNDPKRSARVIIMQRCHANDLAGHLLRRGGYEHLCLPAEFEGLPCQTSLGVADRRTREGELLWPARFGRKEIDNLKLELGGYGAAAQLQQRPSPREGGILLRSWWRFYRRADLPARFDLVIQSWDMAFKDLRSSAFVVGQVWGFAGADCFLLAQKRARLSFVDTLNAVLQMTAQWPTATAMLVEDKANGTAVVDMLRTSVPGLLAVEPEGGKIARASAVSPMIEAGNVHLPHPDEVPWVGGFLEECSNFPNAPNDDQVDAMSQALNWYHHHRRRALRLPSIISLERPSPWRSFDAPVGDSRRQSL